MGGVVGVQGVVVEGVDAQDGPLGLLGEGDEGEEVPTLPSRPYPHHLNNCVSYSRTSRPFIDYMHSRITLTAMATVAWVGGRDDMLGGGGMTEPREKSPGPWTSTAPVPNSTASPTMNRSTTCQYMGIHIRCSVNNVTGMSMSAPKRRTWSWSSALSME